ncbi:hypothetical protein [Glycomyces sp. NPDC048151]|uniref:hypothetical protein n=1 Tax=Glycomyces sp. NPDC048151 TaxID=3364002 RepID=UPI00371F7CEC
MTASPTFKPPRPGWEITAVGAPATGDGELDLRVGYCGGATDKTPAQAAVNVSERRKAGDPIAVWSDLRSSLVPVVLIDGEPRATGWGRIRLPLPAGRHLIQVQSQHSRTWRAFAIEAGKTTKLDYIGMTGESHRAYGEDQLRWNLRGLHGHTIGPRGRLNYYQYLPANAKERKSFLVFMLALFVGAALSAALGYSGVPVGIAIPAGAVIWAGALAFWGFRVLWTRARYNRLEPEPPLDSRAFAPPGSAAPLVLDADGDLPALAGGAAAVLLDARFLKADLASDELAKQLPEGRVRIDGKQAKALNAIGEIVPIRHRYAVPPPEVLLDGVPVGALWTRMWLEVPPGTHRLDVRTPASPLPVEGEAHEPHSAAATVNLGEGEVARIDLAVTVTAVPDPERPVLHLWHCKIDRLGPAREPEPPAAPRADVRGGLRRAVTGRYWETKDDVPPKE